MTDSSPNQDPLEFLKSFWGNMGFPLPGIVTPTLDTDELGRRVADLKAVEGWLKTNLSMLQMTIQGLELQRATLMTMQHMGQAMAGGDAEQKPEGNPFANPALWPWGLMTSPSGTPATETAPAPETPAATASQPKTKPKR